MLCSERQPQVCNETIFPSQGATNHTNMHDRNISIWQSHLARLPDPMKHSVRASRKKLQVGMDVHAHFSYFPTWDSIWPMTHPAMELQRCTDPQHLAYIQQARGVSWWHCGAMSFDAWDHATCAYDHERPLLYFSTKRCLDCSFAWPFLLRQTPCQAKKPAGIRNT